MGKAKAKDDARVSKDDKVTKPKENKQENKKQKKYDPTVNVGLTYHFCYWT